MSGLKLGVVLESLGRPLRPALNLACTLGVRGVQVDAAGELAPDRLSQTGRKDLRHLLRSLNLELTALGVPLRHGFDVAEHLETRVAHVENVLSLAYDLGPRIAIAFPGPIADENDAALPLLIDSLTALGRHGERVGATLALDTGLTPPATLDALLGRLDCGGLGIHLDPATLLIHGYDPAGAVRDLHRWLVHAQARDARSGRGGRNGQEVPLGHGDIDWTAFLGALEEIGFRGWLTIKPTPGPDPASEVKAAVALLRRLGV